MATYLWLIPMPPRTGPRYPVAVSRGQQLCYSDAYARSVEARILALETDPAPSLLLDATVFYPGGGGQPSDTGAITRVADGVTWAVRSARKSDGEIAHELDPEAMASSQAPGIGDQVTAAIDWPRR